MSSTGKLVGLLKKNITDGDSLLDIGGGVGIIQHELFEAGVSTAVQVDASQAYLDVSQSEAEKRGHNERTTYLYGDFVELSPELNDADIVALDRVICCYPDMETLVKTSTSKARKWYGVVYPKDRWYVRVGLWLGNLYCRLRNIDFRVFAHSNQAIDKSIQEEGMELHEESSTFVWKIAVYRKVPVN